MKLAITDACIFIDLYNVNLTDSFFELNYEIHTSYDVIDELYEHQQEVLKVYQLNNRLTVHVLDEVDRKQLQLMKLPKALTPSDKTVLYLAKKNQCMVLSSDKKVRQQAKALSCDYHGMFWILDKLLEFGLIDKITAIAKINQLVASNIMYQNNSVLLAEIKKRIKIWSN